jgi:hypothetical protein
VPWEHHSHRSRSKTTHGTRRNCSRKSIGLSVVDRSVGWGTCTFFRPSAMRISRPILRRYSGLHHRWTPRATCQFMRAPMPRLMAEIAGEKKRQEIRWRPQHLVAFVWSNLSARSFVYCPRSSRSTMKLATRNRFVFIKRVDCSTFERLSSIHFQMLNRSNDLWSFQLMEERSINWDLNINSLFCKIYTFC